MATIELRGVPIPLYRAWEEHSDALLREYVLIAGDETGPFDVGDVSRARQARIDLSDQIASAAVTGATRVDASVVVEDDAGPATFALLQALLDDAHLRAVDGELLALPGLPEIVALRNWICQQVIAQSAGGSPSPWDVDIAEHSPTAALAEWPGMADLPDDVAWIAGDDFNRIIGASPAALGLLRWDAHDIVGQRILVVIPPALRSHHIAGFSNGMVSGTYRLLDQPLEVHAWTHDGQEIPVTLTLKRHTARRGRTVFTAWLEPRETGRGSGGGT